LIRVMSTVKLAVLPLLLPVTDWYIPVLLASMTWVLMVFLANSLMSISPLLPRH